MEKEDARKTPVSLHERRKQVVRLHRKGYGPMKIVELAGLSWGAVNAALKLYEEGGAAALKPKTRGRKILLVLDNLRVHHSKPVKALIEEHREKIEVFFLPSHSPELNPDERLNADLKHKITTTAPARTRKKLLDVTTGYMKLLEQSPGRVASYFGGPHVSYAACRNI